MPNMSNRGARTGCTVDAVIINAAFLIITTDVDYEEFKRSNTHSIAIRPKKYSLKYRGDIHLRISRYFQKGGINYDRVCCIVFLLLPCLMNSNHPVHPAHHLLPMTTVP
jgi:hypothetical protein